MINTVILEVWKIYIQIQLCYLLPECPWASYVTSHPLLSHLKIGENVAGERYASVKRWSIRDWLYPPTWTTEKWAMFIKQ